MLSTNQAGAEMRSWPSLRPSQVLGDLSSASEAVGAAKDAAVESGKYSMSYALRGVAQTQAMLGDAEAAHDSARLIDDRSEGVLTLARVAEVLAEHGDTSMAAEGYRVRARGGRATGDPGGTGQSSAHGRQDVELAWEPTTCRISIQGRAPSSDSHGRP